MKFTCPNCDAVLKAKRAKEPQPDPVCQRCEAYFWSAEPPPKRMQDPPPKAINQIKHSSQLLSYFHDDEIYLEMPFAEWNIETGAAFGFAIIWSIAVGGAVGMSAWEENDLGNGLILFAASCLIPWMLWGKLFGVRSSLKINSNEIVLCKESLFEKSVQQFSLKELNSIASFTDETQEDPVHGIAFHMQDGHRFEFGRGLQKLEIEGLVEKLLAAISIPDRS